MIVIIILTVLIFYLIYRRIVYIKCNELKEKVLNDIDFLGWEPVSYIDKTIIVKSRSALENYDKMKYLKANELVLHNILYVAEYKVKVFNKTKNFINDNKYCCDEKYKKLYNDRILPLLNKISINSSCYRICVDYITRAGNRLESKIIKLTIDDICRVINEPSLLMSKTEYNKYLKEQQKDKLEAKHREYCNKVTKIIDLVTDNKESLIIKGSSEKIDDLVGKLFDKTVNSIKKIKTLDSQEWEIVGGYILNIENDIAKIIDKNTRILDYYKSTDFEKLKATCDSMMSSQREFNEYIDEKVKSISKLFGTRVSRTETENEDEYEYIRPYKKTITPFTAEVSSTVFASAENNPLEYVIKNFYPNKANYPEQIQKLQLLVEELETLKEAKEIIENYKAEYKQYLTDVPAFIMEEDEAGFYSRLGFANISEDTLIIEYKFSYTSGGGMAKRSFSVPMTEETIIELVNTLSNKLTASAFSKEQRALMTKKLREQIKIRDNYTCCTCGNSAHNEPNLLLEIDHIIPVAKGGVTKEDNLQTLCWKCNRAKSSKILNDL